MLMSNFTYSDELWHYGIMGQKWGVRRYQNEDGTYTTEGKERYSKSDAKREFKARNNAIYEKTQKLEEEVESKYKRGDTLSKKDQDTLNKRYSDQEKELKASKEQYKADVKRAAEESGFHLTDNQKKAMMIGGTLIADGLIAYGAYTLNKG